MPRDKSRYYSLLEQAFPLHLTFDDQLVIVKVGPRLRELRPQVKAGTPLLSHVRVERPRKPLDADTLGARTDEIFVFEFPGDGDLRLRGQMFRENTETGLCIHFLAVPWIRGFADLKPQGLDIRDFPPHSAIGEVLVLLQAKESSYRDTRAMAERLKKTSQELLERNRELERTLKDRSHLEEQLRQSQKMEAIGQLAGGIAHDFNNILLAIMGHADLGLSDDNPENIKERLHEILDAAQRATEITTQLLAFGRRQVFAASVLDLGTALEEVRSMLDRLIGDRITIKTTCEKTVPSVVVDSSGLQQVLLNLALNARDAMEDGGVLTISVVSHSYQRGRHVTSGELPKGEWAAISVSDDGIGMAEDILHRVFEPFFTTKERGKGTGLGLATVWWILERIGGYIDVESTVDVGSTFTVFLPIASEEEASNAAQEKPEEEGIRGSGSILVVDDDPAVRKVVGASLEAVGYEVTVRESGVSALDELDSGAHIDLMITDISMKGMTGWELLRKVNDRWPDVKLMAMTGYDDDSMAEAGIVGVRVLHKPFSPSALSRAVEDVLGGSPGV